MPGMTYPTISDKLASQLAEIEPSGDGRREFKPCRAVLRDGGVLDRVIAAPALENTRPSTDEGWTALTSEANQTSVSIRDVVGFEPTTARLPAQLANKVYEAGESGMGYTLFVVVLRDGSQLPFVSGWIADFPNLPPGVGTEDIVDVLPHAGREHFQQPLSPERAMAVHHWCRYRTGT